MAVDAIRGERTLAELAQLHDVHANQIVDWKNQLLTRAAGVFGADTVAAPALDLKDLHAKIGRLALENDFLAGARDKTGLVEQSDDRPQPCIAHQAPGGIGGHQPGQCVRPAQRGA